MCLLKTWTMNSTKICYSWIIFLSLTKCMTLNRNSDILYLRFHIRKIGITIFTTQWLWILNHSYMFIVDIKTHTKWSQPPTMEFLLLTHQWVWYTFKYHFFSFPFRHSLSLQPGLDCDLRFSSLCLLSAGIHIRWAQNCYLTLLISHPFRH